MKEHPILFSTTMVQAIMEGRKTMTRRVVKPQPEERENKTLKGHFGLWWKGWNIDSQTSGIYPETVCPYGKVVDKLWVRETFCAVNLPSGAFSHYAYRADDDKLQAGFCKWKPSIFMPRKAFRIVLEITNVRVERLQDISEQDAINEGIEKLKGEDGIWAYRSYHVKPGKEQLIPCAPYVSFRTLWQSINGYESWNQNPWVWVIEFKKIV